MAKKTKPQKKSGGMREKAKKKAERNMNRGSNFKLDLPEGVELYQPNSTGPYHWDIIPYVVQSSTHPEVEKGEMWYQRTYYVHHNLGEDGNKSVVCPRSVNKPCPICEHVRGLFNSEDEDDRELAKTMKAKERELFNIIDLDNQDDGVRIMEYSYHLFGKILDEEINEADEEVADFAELEGGKTLKVKFRKKKLGQNPFYEAKSIDFEDREDYDDDILEEVYDLDNLLIIRSYDELTKLVAGAEEIEDEESEEKEPEDEEEEEEEEEKPKKKGKSSSAKKKSSSGKKSSKKKDDDDDDDDEEEKENKSKKAGRKPTGKKKKGKDKNKCPAGGEFGVDTNEFDECKDCDLWTACEDANQQNEDDDEE